MASAKISSSPKLIISRQATEESNPARQVLEARLGPARRLWMRGAALCAEGRPRPHLGLEGWSRTICLRVMNPPPSRSASSSGVTNRTLTDTSGFTPRRPDLGPWSQYERVDSNHQPPAYQTGAPTIAPRSRGANLREETRVL